MVAVGERLPFGDARFDGVFSINVLEHVIDLERVLAESARVLADGGLWLAVTPNGNWEGLLDLAERWSLKIPEGPHRFLTTRRLREAVGRYLDVLEHRTMLVLPAGPPGVVVLGRHRQPLLASGAGAFSSTSWPGRGPAPGPREARLAPEEVSPMLQTNPLAPPPVGLNAISASTMKSIADRERVSDWYWTHKDKLIEMRVWWRACTARHMLHLLPGETILELGCGSGTLTRALEGVSRGECPITAATFDPGNDLSWLAQRRCRSTEGVRLSGFPGELEGRQFDYVIASNVLDHSCAAPLLDRGPEAPQAGGPAVVLRDRTRGTRSSSSAGGSAGCSRFSGGATSGCCTTKSSSTSCSRSWAS